MIYQQSRGSLEACRARCGGSRRRVRGDGARGALDGGARGTLEGPSETTGLADAFFNYYYLIITARLWLEPMVINHCHHRFGTNGDNPCYHC